mmetsp:Transcript_33652/g.87285  ORF Transcript_33652/g.87285 Transcript_33652/m.87285 type:complete len:224 (+) Transcript_33652:373-1044(+)
MPSFQPAGGPGGLRGLERAPHAGLDAQHDGFGGERRDSGEDATTGGDLPAGHAIVCRPICGSVSQPMHRHCLAPAVVLSASLALHRARLYIAMVHGCAVDDWEYMLHIHAPRHRNVAAGDGGHAGHPVHYGIHRLFRHGRVHGDALRRICSWFRSYLGSPADGADRHLAHHVCSRPARGCGLVAARSGDCAGGMHWQIHCSQVQYDAVPSPPGMRFCAIRFSG